MADKTRWCEWFYSSHGCRWGDRCSHAHYWRWSNGRWKNWSEDDWWASDDWSTALVDGDAPPPQHWGTSASSSADTYRGDVRQHNRTTAPELALYIGDAVVVGGEADGGDGGVVSPPPLPPPGAGRVLMSHCCLQCRSSGARVLIRRHRLMSHCCGRETEMRSKTCLKALTMLIV